MILEKAEFLIRTRGYSAFSYADLAEHAAVTKASVHYHFPSKEDLGIVLVQEFIDRSRSMLEDIKRQHSGPIPRLRAYAELFLEGFEQGMLPPCGALSAERSALPETMRPRVVEFFQLQLDWIANVLEEGRVSGALCPTLSSDLAAMLLLSVLEGGSVIGWALDRKACLLAAVEAALKTIAMPSAVNPPGGTS